MQFVRQKTIKGKKYYYLDYSYRYNGFRKTFTSFVGKTIPNNIDELLINFFSDVSDKIYSLYWKQKEQKQKVFPPKGLFYLEKYKLNFLLIQHQNFRKDYELFKTLFSILFILNSNRSEGSKVTRADIELIVKGTKKPRTAIDVEIVNSFNAFEFALTKMKYTIKDIKELHKILLKDLHLEAGLFKKSNNIAGSGFTEASKTSNWQNVETDLTKLLEWFSLQLKNKEYLPKIILEFHSRFEKIHPFIDGNGRTGRLIMNAMLIRSGYHPVIFFTQNHSSYSNAIGKSILGNPMPLAKHFIESLKKTDYAIKTYKKEGIIKGGSKQMGNWELSKGKIKLY
jgi:fido (protein-threonine AMPylation protein)